RVQVHRSWHVPHPVGERAGHPVTDVDNTHAGRVGKACHVLGLDQELGVRISSADVDRRGTAQGGADHDDESDAAAGHGARQHRGPPGRPRLREHAAARILAPRSIQARRATGWSPDPERRKIGRRRRSAHRTQRRSRVSTQHWRRGLDRPILMIPGPTEVPWRVIRAMAQPAMIQYEPPFDDEILEPACLDLRQIFQTSGEVIAMPGSGRTGLEAASISLIEPGDRVVVVVAGVFGNLMKEVMDRAGAAVTAFDVELGRSIDLEGLERTVAKVRPKIVTLVHNETSTGVTYPAGAVGEITRRHGALFLLDSVSSLAGLDVQTDAWGVDVNMTGSQ